jgi:hypothetical protein
VIRLLQAAGVTFIGFGEPVLNFVCEA